VGEIAWILLGIQESISRTEERECFPENRAWELVTACMPRIPFMAGASGCREMHHAGQSALAFKVAELSDLQGDSKWEVRSLHPLPAWLCQPRGTLPIFWYLKWVTFESRNDCRRVFLPA
jgi:hypothetical protein